MYVEEDKSVPEMAAAGYPEECRAEGRDAGGPERVQATPGPPGVKITPRALGKDRRMPITNGSNG